jgi:hypothetical protein
VSRKLPHNTRKKLRKLRLARELEAELFLEEKRQSKKAAEWERSRPAYTRTRKGQR